MQRIYARTCKRVFKDLEAVRRPCMPACIFSTPEFLGPQECQIGKNSPERRT
jgi:hypothetical protein